MGFLKVIRKFFKTITKVLDGISGITKNMIFSHLKACERRNFDFCVFLLLCSGSRCHWRTCDAYAGIAACSLGVRLPQSGWLLYCMYLPT